MEGRAAAQCFPERAQFNVAQTALGGPSPLSNRLLAAMSARDFQALRPFLETVHLERREILMDVGARIEHVYFPHSAVVTQMITTAEGWSAETAMIGFEGLVGCEALMDSRSAAGITLVQVAGSASRIAVRDIRAALESASLRALLRRYAGARFAQVSQSAVCNGVHKLEQRCAKWLLAAQDRAQRDRLDITQEFLAEILGVYRSRLAVVMQSLRNEGLVRGGRGAVTIADRAGLEAAACDCYGTVKQIYNELYRATLAA